MNIREITDSWLGSRRLTVFHSEGDHHNRPFDTGARSTAHRGANLPLVISIAGSFILAGCAGKPSTPQTSPSAENLAWSQNGWSDAERTEYYHLPEGSELMPYLVLANLVNVRTGKLFLENMDRFGFVADSVGPT